MPEITVGGQEYVLPDELTPEQHDHVVKSLEAEHAAKQPATPEKSYTTYVIGEKQFQIPNDMPEDIKTEYLTGKVREWEASQATPQPITGDSLQHDSDWLHASKVTYAKREGKPFAGTDAEAADYGLNTMGWFNYNLPRMAVDANRMRTADPEEQKAFLHLMETYDKLGISWAGTGRAIKGIALDPTSWVGLSTLGIGMAGSTAAKLATKEGVKAALRSGIQAGLDGALWSSVQDAVQQSARINAGGQQEYNPGQTLKAGAIGASVGAALGGAAHGLIHGVAAGRGAKAIVQDSPELAGELSGRVGPDTPSVAAGDAGATLRIDPTAEPHALPEPAPGPTNDVIEAITREADSTGVRDFPVLPDHIATKAADPVAVLLGKTPKEASQAIEELRVWASTPEQEQLLGSTLMHATKALDEEGTKLIDLAKAGDTKALQRLDELDILRLTIKEADTDFSSMAGTRLGERAKANLFNTGENRGLTVDDILREQGVNPEIATAGQRSEAQVAYYDRYRDYLDTAQASKEVELLTDQIEEKFKGNDIGGALADLSRKNELVDAQLRKELDKAGITGKAQSSIRTGLKAVNEYVISTVFSPATIVANTLPAILKTAYTPLLHYVAHDPLSKVELRRMTSTYGAMYANTGVALQAAKAAFRYERSLLSMEGNRLLENGPVIPGLAGRLLRTFPRVLGTTDEFFAQVNYRGFVVGQATADAVEVAAARGLKGAEADSFIEQRVQEAITKSFTVEPDANNTLALLKHQGEQHGLKGAQLEQWVRGELAKNGDLFRTATDRVGRDYADDLLFKRKFSGDNTASTLATRYEEWVNDNPWMRLMGQLFFRTPVRVFEEGLRLTPGVNMATHLVTGRSSIISDLRGLNGPVRQMRAQGESMLSLAFAGAVATLYAQGRITGGGPSDHKEKRALQDAREWEPYSLRFADGSTFSFKNLDPFATPFKIMVNALDRLSMIQYRKAQGDYVGEVTKETTAYISAATLSVAEAIKDASLMNGVDQLVQFVQILADPESKENAFTRFAGQKMKLATPAVVKKSNLQASPELHDPATIADHALMWMELRSSEVPKQYDALGKVRTVANPMSALVGLNYTTTEQREASRTDKELAVLRELAKVELASGKSFTMPHKMKEQFGEVDLRTQPTEDGNETRWDRLNRYFAETDVTDYLHRNLVGHPERSYGTETVAGVKTRIATEVIEAFRKVAGERMIKEEAELHHQRRKREREKGMILQGGREVSFQPYK